MNDDPVLDHCQQIIDKYNEIHNLQPDMVMQAVVLVSLMDMEKGTKHIKFLKGGDIRSWEAIGMMDFLTTELKAEISAAHLQALTENDGD